MKAMIKVNSSNIESIGYEDNTLYVQFKNGTQYRYTGISEFTYNELMKAESHGKFFCANIRNNFPYAKI